MFINASGEFPETLPEPPVPADEALPVDLAQISHGCDAPPSKTSFCDFSNSGDLSYREWSQKLLDFGRADHEETIGFFPVRSDLRKKFIGCNTGRCGQAGLL